MTTENQMEAEKEREADGKQHSDLGRSCHCLQWCSSRDPSQGLCASVETSQ